MSDADSGRRGHLRVIEGQGLTERAMPSVTSASRARLAALTEAVRARQALEHPPAVVPDEPEGDAPA